MAIFVTLFIYWSNTSRMNKVSSWIMLFLASSTLIVLATFRGNNVGHDQVWYVNTFLSKTTLNLDLARVLGLKSTEPLWLVYLYVLRSITSNSRVFLFVNAIVYTIPLVFILKELWKDTSNYAFMPLFIIDYVYKFSAIRSGFAEAFVLFAILSLKKGYYVKAIMLCLIGAMFHYTAFIGALFILFYYVQTTTIKGLSHIKRTIFVLSITFAVMLVSFALVYILRGTKYTYYLSQSGTIIGNAFVIVLFIILISIDLQKTDIRYSIAIYGALFSGIITPAVIILGAYRLPDFFTLLRLISWTLVSEFCIRSSSAYISSNLTSRIVCSSKSNTRINFVSKIVPYFAMVIYLLYKLSRVANNSSIMPYIL